MAHALKPLLSAPSSPTRDACRIRGVRAAHLEASVARCRLKYRRLGPNAGRIDVPTRYVRALREPVEGAARTLLRARAALMVCSACRGTHPQYDARQVGILAILYGRRRAARAGLRQRGRRPRMAGGQVNSVCSRSAPTTSPHASAPPTFECSTWWSLRPEETTTPLPERRQGAGREERPPPMFRARRTPYHPSGQGSGGSAAAPCTRLRRSHSPSRRSIPVSAPVAVSAPAAVSALAVAPAVAVAPAGASIRRKHRCRRALRLIAARALPAVQQVHVRHAVALRIRAAARLALCLARAGRRVRVRHPCSTRALRSSFVGTRRYTSVGTGTEAGVSVGATTCVGAGDRATWMPNSTYGQPVTLSKRSSSTNARRSQFSPKRHDTRQNSALHVGPTKEAWPGPTCFCPPL